LYDLFVTASENKGAESKLNNTIKENFLITSPKSKKNKILQVNIGSFSLGIDNSLRDQIVSLEYVLSRFTKESILSSKGNNGMSHLLGGAPQGKHAPRWW
jgi:hypothetical protein